MHGSRECCPVCIRISELFVRYVYAFQNYLSKFLQSSGTPPNAEWRDSALQLAFWEPSKRQMASFLQVSTFGADFPFWITRNFVKQQMLFDHSTGTSLTISSVESDKDRANTINCSGDCWVSAWSRSAAAKRVPIMRSLTRLGLHALKLPTLGITPTTQ